MKLKTVEVNGTVYAEVQDGKPIFVHSDGKELPFDAVGTVAKISQLNGEAKGHRERAEAAEAKLKLFDGIEDVEKARAALETVKNLDGKQLIDAGKVEEVKAEAKRAFEAQVDAIKKEFQPVLAERDKLKGDLQSLTLGGAFTRSKFIGEKLAIPADMAQSQFGSHFTIEEGGKIVAKDKTGNQIYSRAKPGEVADFDEALELIVDSYAYRDQIVKGTGASGGGAQGGGNTGGKRTYTRAQFEDMSPTDRLSVGKEAASGKVVIVD